MPAPTLIAIAGPSCSGKTTLSRRIADLAPVPATLIALDHFYRDLAHLAPDERAAVNFDHPASLDWPLFRSVVDAIAVGQSARIPAYSFKQHVRLPDTESYRPAPLVVLEGLYTLFDPQVRRHLRLGVFLDVAEPEALARRLSRDVAERGRTPESVRVQFSRTVCPMWRQFGEPTRQYADLQFAGHGNFDAAVREILTRLNLAGRPAAADP